MKTREEIIRRIEMLGKMFDKTSNMKYIDMAEELAWVAGLEEKEFEKIFMED